MPSQFKRKATSEFLACQIKRTNDAQEYEAINDYVTWAEYERTALVKSDTNAPKCAAIEKGT